MAAVTSDAASRRQFVAMVFCRLQNKGISKAFHWMNGNNFSIGEGGGEGRGGQGGGVAEKAVLQTALLCLRNKPSVNDASLVYGILSWQ